MAYNPDSAKLINIPLNGIADNSSRIMVWDVDANVIQIINTLDNSVYAELGGGFKHYLGEAYLGGVIFNIYKGEDGLEHGHIVNLSEVTAGVVPGTGLQWSTDIATIEGADSSWDGISNTANMVDATSPAKQYINTLGAGWYLPSIDELNILFNNRYYVNKGLAFIPGTIPLQVNTPYWASTESDAASAWILNFGFGFIDSAIIKNNKQSVRGIKSF